MYENQKKYQKANMLQIKASYKKEFVQEFRNACHSLGLVQSKILKNAMENVIEQNILLEKKLAALNKCRDLKFYQDSESYNMSSIAIDVFENNVKIYTINIFPTIFMEFENVDDIINFRLFTNEGMDKLMPEPVQQVFKNNSKIINNALKKRLGKNT